MVLQFPNFPHVILRFSVEERKGNKEKENKRRGEMRERMKEKITALERRRIGEKKGMEREAKDGAL